MLDVHKPWDKICGVCRRVPTAVTRYSFRGVHVFWFCMSVCAHTEALLFSFKTNHVAVNIEGKKTTICPIFSLNNCNWMYEVILNVWMALCRLSQVNILRGKDGYGFTICSDSPVRVQAVDPGGWGSAIDWLMGACGHIPPTFTSFFRLFRLLLTK